MQGMDAPSAALQGELQNMARPARPFSLAGAPAPAACGARIETPYASELTLQGISAQSQRLARFCSSTPDTYTEPLGLHRRRSAQPQRLAVVRRTLARRALRVHLVVWSCALQRLDPAPIAVRSISERGFSTA